jgi:hypothetical protein
MLTQPHSLLACIIYYYFWIHILPRLRGYRIRQATLTLANGAQTHSLVKVPASELAHWDATHHAAGRSLNDETCLDHNPDGGLRTDEEESIQRRELIDPCV